MNTVLDADRFRHTTIKERLSYEGAEVAPAGNLFRFVFSKYFCSSVVLRPLPKSYKLEGYSCVVVARHETRQYDMVS